MNGNTMISNVIPALLIVLAGAMLALLYNESHERKQLLLAIAATVVACYSLAILVLEHLP